MPAAPSTRGAALTCHSWLIGCIILLVVVTAQGIRYEHAFQTGTDPRFYFEYIYDHEPGSIAPLVDRCRDAYNGTLAAADTEEMYEAIKVAIKQYDDYLYQYNGLTVLLGGSFTDGDCSLDGPTYCPYCWDNGQRNCAIGDARQFGLAKKGSFWSYVHTRGHNGWESSKAAADPNKPYVCYYGNWHSWASCAMGTNDVVMCVATTQSTSSFENLTSETNSSGRLALTTQKPSWWWIVLVVVAVVLMIAVAVLCVIFLCYCGAVAPVVGRVTSEDDDGLSSVRGTSSNYIIASRKVS